MAGANRPRAVTAVDMQHVGRARHVSAPPLFRLPTARRRPVMSVNRSGEGAPRSHRASAAPTTPRLGRGGPEPAPAPGSGSAASVEPEPEGVVMVAPLLFTRCGRGVATEESGSVARASAAMVDMGGRSAMCAGVPMSSGRWCVEMSVLGE
jgi:hypothetical protein